MKLSALSGKIIMKNLLYIVLLTTQVFFAQNGFENGNTLYQKGKYQEAITAYESVLKQDKHSSDLYFNMANCYFKLNKVAPAIFHYEKALLLDPENESIKNNLKFAQKLQIDDIKTVPKVGFYKLIQGVTGTYHYNAWGWIAVSLSVLFLLLFVGYYFSQITWSKRLFFVGMLVVVLFFGLSVGSALFEKNRYQAEQPAIVYAEVASVKGEPKENAPDAFILHEGTKVNLIEKLGPWAKIQLTDQTEGWLEIKNIRLVKEEIQ